MAPNENAYGFLPPAPSNTSRLQSALHGSKRKAEVASARRKSPDDDSALPRLLMAVYTPLLRCATASDACNLAAGYGLSKRGAASVPRFAFLIRFAYALETFFLRSAHRFFIKSDNRLLPAGVRRLPFLLLRAARCGTALVLAADFGASPSNAAMARLSRSLSLFSSATILPVSKVLSCG
jgi:hypothetical protein